MMKKLLLTWAALIGLTCSAQAATWPLSFLNIYGNVEVDPAASTIEFYPGSSLIAQPYQATGAFSALNLNNVTMSWQNMGVDLPYSVLGSGSDLSCGSNCLMTFTDGVISASFNLDPSTFQVLDNAPNHVLMIGAGTISMTGYDSSFAWWGLDLVPVDAAYGWWPQVGFVVPQQALHAPGPIVGAGLPGLVLAGGGMLALARRRRKAAAV